VHARELTELSDRARRAEEPTAALSLWREALDLLPPGCRQHETISAKVAALSRQVDAEAPSAPAAAATDDHADGKSGFNWGKGAIGVGALALVLWKFKFVLVFVLTKLKWLLLGLTKASTLFSMVLSLGVYWAAWGWKFALGLVLSIYVHEMGHVAALRRLGIKASSPMFIPGLGALVRLRQAPNDPREDARIGLAGPIWGLGAAIGAYCVSLATGWPSWAAIARVGAWINLFNLLPVWQLDGGRGFRAMSRGQRWLAVLTVGAMLLLTGEGMLVLLLLAGGMRALAAGAETEGNRRACMEYIFLIISLSAMCMIDVGITSDR